MANSRLSIVRSTAATVFAAIMAVPLLIVSPPTHSNVTASGVDCIFNNLQQALNSPIIWDGFRVRNLNSTASRFVLCPIDNPTDLDDGSVVATIEGGSINITGWFGPGAANDAEIVCIVRENIVSGGTPTGGDAVTVTIPRDTGDPIPDVEQVSTGALPGFQLGVAIVASCNLPPNTGIQLFQVSLAT